MRNMIVEKGGESEAALRGPWNSGQRGQIHDLFRR